MKKSLPPPDAETLQKLLSERGFDRVVLLPHPSVNLSPNGRPHWAAKAKEADEVKRRTYAYLERMDYMASADPRNYKVLWMYKGVEPDDDNIICRVKYVRDAIAEYYGINDRTMRVAGVETVNMMRMSEEQSLPGKAGEPDRKRIKSLAGWCVVAF